jgi:Fe-S-cluster containining protein
MSRVEEVSKLYQIDAAIDARASQIVTHHEGWPCRRGCADCCRSLAAVPTISAVEWQRMRAAYRQLPDAVRERVHAALASLDDTKRPVVCPFLDPDNGACLIYDARPIRCRSYGFYAEREGVLGCQRIEAIAYSGAAVVWGNHAALDFELSRLTETKSLVLFVRDEV